ncbi:MAG: urea amidolyase family protein [Pseudoclavibacter sp.]
MSAPRILPMGDAALLVETEDLGTAAALYDALAAAARPGVRELVAGARTVLVRYAPAETDAAALAAWIGGLRPSTGARDAGALVRVPVVYDGEDLDDVAQLTGLGRAEVIRRHAAAEYRVAFTGFAPGFAYLVGGDPALDVPRRRAPRAHVPAGAVGLAGAYSGVYPRSSPGGWQLIGSAAVPMWDERRDPPALLAPGMRVRFEAVDQIEPAGVSADAAAEPVVSKDGAGVLAATAQNPVPRDTVVQNAAARTASAAGLRIRRPGLRLTVQDLGRPGLGRFGVSASGAMDRGALVLANAAVGNRRGAAALESCLGQVEAEADEPLTVAVVGAAPELTVRRQDGRRIEWSEGTPIPLAAGDRLAIGALCTGTFTYLAVRGGVRAAESLGSASTDTLSGLGPSPLAAGDRLSIGSTAGLPATRDERLALPAPAAPSAAAPILVDAIPGPRDDWFTPAGRDAFWSGTWRVSPRSDRVGIRLEGEGAPAWAADRELPSEGMIAGAIEVPAGGTPVVLMADHPVTGGYPVIACVASWHLSRLAQVPAGTGARFRKVGGAVPSASEQSGPQAAPERNAG